MPEMLTVEEIDLIIVFILAYQSEFVAREGESRESDKIIEKLKQMKRELQGGCNGL